MQILRHLDVVAGHRQAADLRLVEDADREVVELGPRPGEQRHLLHVVLELVVRQVGAARLEGGVDDQRGDEELDQGLHQWIWCSSRPQRVPVNRCVTDPREPGGRCAILGRLERPVDEQRAALHVGRRQEPPVAAVLGVVAVVAHHEVVVPGDGHRPVLPPHVAGRLLALGRGREQVVRVRLVSGAPLTSTVWLRSSMRSPGRPITRLMKSRSGSSGNLNTSTSPRRTWRIGSTARSRPVAAGPEHELVDQQVIADQQVRLHRAGRNLEGLEDERPHEQREDHRDDDRLEVFADGRLAELGLIFSHLQDGEERFLRDLDPADPLHALLALFLLFEQFALARYIPTVTFRQHVLAQRLHTFARDDPRSDRRLDGHLEHLPRDQLPHLRGQHPAAFVGRGRDGR